MRTIDITYYNALRLNSIMWVNYVAKIIDINKVPEFTSSLQFALNQANIILTLEQQLYMDCLLNLDFFQNNFADSMVYAYRLLNLLPPPESRPIEFISIPSLAQVGAIEYIFPFQDGTYDYVGVLSVPGNNLVNVNVTDLIEQAATDPIIPPEDQAFIQSLIKIGAT